jgi:hypothetical protein
MNRSLGNRSLGAGASAAAMLALLLLGLIALAERAGLPLPYVERFLIATTILAFALVTGLAATARERSFMGLETVVGPAGGGAALAAAVWILVGFLGLAADAGGWLAVLVGAPLGVVFAHLLLRLSPVQRSEGAGRLAQAFGDLARAAVGLFTLYAALRTAAPEASRLLGLSGLAAALLVGALAALPLLVGGARAALALASGAAGTAAAILLCLAGAGLLFIGRLPLPGESEVQTLELIAEARRQWGVAAPVHLVAWPSLSLLGESAALRAFGIAFAAAAALGLAAAPALPLRRRSAAAGAALALVLLPLLTTAVAGYAVEAAVRFVGAPASRPPAALLASSGLGLVTVCGATAGDAEALRTACGLAPRDPAQLGWQRLGLKPAFLDGGLAAALGAPATAALSANGWRLAMALAAAVLGLWIAGRAAGLLLMGRRRQSPGLASLRLGVVRVSTLLIAGAAAAALIEGMLLPAEAAALLGAGALVLAVLQLRGQRPAPQTAALTTIRPSGRTTTAPAAE